MTAYQAHLSFEEGPILRPQPVSNRSSAQT
jgi:hypothetical protein